MSRYKSEAHTATCRKAPIRGSLDIERVEDCYNVGYMSLHATIGCIARRLTTPVSTSVYEDAAVPAEVIKIAS
jgi:hypothetical protein